MALMVLCAGVAIPFCAQPSAAQGTTLYRLETTCTIRGGAPQDCVVEVTDEGDSTVYRHTIGSRVEVIRVSDPPLRMGILDAPSGRWRQVKSAGARFSTNTICYDDRDLCVINPNHLNSVREERVDSLEGRDLVGVRFGADGRVILTCYDEGCEGLK
ncbi:hypothetical protein [Cyanobium sp. CH-040]|uniref:hypothetical protein n=1 Tax=Cyanobium sp. CH-040 TaxID=2823708 RepID=UPI0020CBEEC2|nr:hypothetical protein [Cyanobium sp. CH-040]MCP9927005.1 hypothetical protein [Cyanobium sp. CH-040]